MKHRCRLRVQRLTMRPPKKIQHLRHLLLLYHVSSYFIYTYAYDIYVIYANTALARTTRPYGIPSMHELLRVLVSLCDPHDLHYTDTMRQSALSILLAAIEVGGHSISKFSTLRTLIADQLLCYAFQASSIYILLINQLTLYSRIAP
jgi:hypothetical protein